MSAGSPAQARHGTGFATQPWERWWRAPGSGGPQTTPLALRVASKRRAAAHAAGPLIALFAELAAKRLARAPEDGPGVAETTARLMRDLEPAPLAAALLADRFSCPLGAAA